VAKPLPPTPDYQFELPIKVVDKQLRESTNFIDCWKAGHFALEAKATDVPEENDGPLRRAYGQVRNYATQLPGTAPAFLMTVDVPRTLVVWEGWNRDWGGFPAGRRIPLATLHERPDDIRLLQDIWTNSAARDPREKAQQVSREIAAKLAELFTAFEGRGHDPARVFADTNYVQAEPTSGGQAHRADRLSRPKAGAGIGRRAGADWKS
jgi:hypothetical protein